MADQDFTADLIDTSRPHPARMYDYYLGGRDNYEVDRDAAEQIIAFLPVIRDGARENRGFMQRAVRAAVADYGIRQIIDVGTGIPTSPNTHEVAQDVAPQTRVVYVDNDPIVGTHAQCRLRGVGQTAFVLGDVRKPQSILSSPEIGSLIDFGQPVALLLVALLHFVSDRDDPAGIVATLRDALPPGSLVVISHASRDEATAQEEVDLTDLTDVYESTTAPLSLRGYKQVYSFFDGMELLDPGLVSVADWRRTTEKRETDMHGIGIYGGVGRVL